MMRNGVGRWHTFAAIIKPASLGHNFRALSVRLCCPACCERAAAPSVTPVVADATQPDQAQALVEAAVAAHGGIDILVNNVGGGGGGARVADSSDDDWRGALERNLMQTVRMMRLALPHMKDRPGAAVINIASISGWSPQLARGIRPA